MQTTGEDYYDIPDDELPSANFAARSTNEISELGLLDIDDLSTFMSFASISSEHEYTDSEDEINDGPTPAAHYPKTPLMPQPEMPRTPPDTPTITVNSPSRRQSLLQRLRSVSDVASIMRRPSMRQKADTAPPGAFNAMEYAPQVPRRAMSARLDNRSAARRRHSRHPSSESDLKARRVLGMNETLVEEERPRRANSYEEGDDWDEDNELDLSQPNASFSRKARVRETLEKKKLSRLRMNFVGSKPDSLVDSPQSMLHTPMEPYHPTPERQPGRLRPTSAIHGKRGTSTPVSPTTPSPFPRPQSRPDDRFAGDEDLQDLYQTRVYAPGPVCLEKHPALLRRDSVATLDPFASEIDPIGRRPSDLMALEQVVMYFDGMGLITEATDDGLDRYWLNGALQETEPDVTELTPQHPRSRQSSSSKDGTVLSRFSFSSASSSSGAAVPQDSPPKRQLIRLRRLLSPALPGLRNSES